MQILFYLEILQSRLKLLEEIKNELREIKKEFATPRKSEIIDREYEEVDVLKYIQKEDGKFYDKDNKTLLSGKYTLDEKYSNQNTIFEIKFSGGELKESTYYYPTGKTLCSKTWEDQCLVQSEMFHYNGITSQIENYEDGLCIFSKSFELELYFLVICPVSSNLAASLSNSSTLSSTLSI